MSCSEPHGRIRRVGWIGPDETLPVRCGRRVAHRGSGTIRFREVSRLRHRTADRLHPYTVQYARPGSDRGSRVLKEIVAKALLEASTVTAALEPEPQL